MPGRMKIAFWNVENLFEAETHRPPQDCKNGRGPQSAKELAAKIQRLAGCVNRFFGSAGPDLLALAEVHTERILKELESKLADSYRYVWEPAGTATETGLAVLARESVVRSMDTLSVQRPAGMANARPRCMVVLCDFQGCGEPFVLAVNHWKSLVIHNDAAAPVLPPAGLPATASANAKGGTNDLDRAESAEWLGNWLANACPTRSAVVVGDSNSEPTAYYSDELRLRCSRRFGSALRT